MLVLEDLHWVDPSTLDFLSAVARRSGVAEGQRLTVALAPESLRLFAKE